MLQPAVSGQPFNANVTPSAGDPSLNPNAVIPGISLQETPACVSEGATGADIYVAGAQHTNTSNFTPGSYALSEQVGQTNPAGIGTRTISQSVASPSTPTMIDSWAAVIE
jgi:hypothetical protein